MNINDSGLTVYQLRLLDCAAIVRNGNGNFDLEWWRADFDVCGTTRCAVGDYIAATKPTDIWLKRAGGTIFHYVCNLDGEQNYLAVARHFGITEAESEALFSPDAYDAEHLTDRAYVADRIEQFVMAQLQVNRESSEAVTTGTLE